MPRAASASRHPTEARGARASAIRRAAPGQRALWRSGRGPRLRCLPCALAPERAVGPAVKCSLAQPPSCPLLLGHSPSRLRADAPGCASALHACGVRAGTAQLQLAFHRMRLHRCSLWLMSTRRGRGPPRPAHALDRHQARVPLARRLYMLGNFSRSSPTARSTSSWPPSACSSLRFSSAAL